MTAYDLPEGATEYAPADPALYAELETAIAARLYEQRHADAERYSEALAGGAAILWCANGHQMHDPVTVADSARRARVTMSNLPGEPRCTPWSRHPACINYHPEPGELAAQLAQGRRPDPEPARCYTRLASPNAQHRCARPYHHSGPHSRFAPAASAE